eukprot:4192850-Lingulodinium_polyedra.AAC.1
MAPRSWRPAPDGGGGSGGGRGSHQREGPSARLRSLGTHRWMRSEPEATDSAVRRRQDVSMAKLELRPLAKARMVARLSPSMMRRLP